MTSSSSRIRELEELERKVRRAHIEAVKMGEYELARMLLDAEQKIGQKIDGHRAQKKRRK